MEDLEHRAPSGTLDSGDGISAGLFPRRGAILLDTPEQHSPEHPAPSDVKCLIPSGGGIPAGISHKTSKPVGVQFLLKLPKKIGCARKTRLKPLRLGASRRTFKHSGVSGSSDAEHLNGSPEPFGALPVGSSSSGASFLR